MKTRLQPLPIPLLALTVALHLLLVPGDWTSLVADLAVLAALVAADDRRMPAMLAAAGLAAGLAPHGLLVVPIVVAVAVRARATPADWTLLPLAACAALALPLVPANPPPAIGLWAMSEGPVRGLWIAAAAGLGGWFAAAGTIRPAGSRIVDGSALLLALAWVLLLPAGPGDLVLPLALAFVLRRDIRRTPPANDNRPWRIA